MIKAVLFDFDGTLINTNDLIFKSYEVAFEKVLNRKIGMPEILELYGKPLYSSLIKYGEKGEWLYKVYREFNEIHHDEMAKPFEGVYEGIKLIRQKGYAVGIVTSKRLHMVKRGLEIINLADDFEVIVTPDDTEKTKPDPEPILCGCKKLNISPQNVLYVGDSIFDMKAAESAGSQLCAVKYSVTPHAELLKFKPLYFVDSILELAEKLECQH
jgi:pyrophosphatase PpaX